MPGRVSAGRIQPLSVDELRLERQLRGDVGYLAGVIGERNIPAKAPQLEAAARFLDSSFSAVGSHPQSQWYAIGQAKCRNVEVEIPGAAHRDEVVIIGAHYDSAPGSPGADDNASGVAAMLALARSFSGTHPSRTLRFVAFANEEPPYFWSDAMGSLVYAKRCQQRGEHIVAMLSLESVGYYSDSPHSQHYPAGLGLLYPSTGNFVAFVGNVFSRSLVQTAIRSFRGATMLPSEGAAVPNAIPGVGWSDHWSFWQQGFPGIEITDTAPYRNPYYHTPADTPDRLDYARLARLTVAMRAVVGEISESTSRGLAPNSSLQELFRFDAALL